MEFEICKINESENIKKEAAIILLETFPKTNMWTDINEKIAFETVNECIKDDNISIGIKIDNHLIGWIGIRPMYDKTWELHPIVIKHEFQNMGYGRILINEIEKIAIEKGIIGIMLGSDDESNKTSLSEKEITGENIFQEIKNIRNYNRHPYEFYKKCGYCIVGIIPNANGHNKPDILLWKDIRRKKM
jgi:aminoglycoside 6'-N-acetyltransferase I